MNIIDRIFRGGSTVTATATPAEQAATEQELAARLAAVNQQIAAGDGDLVVALEERDHLKRQIEAARIKRDAETQRANREARAAQIAEFDKQRDKVMIRLNAAVVEIIFATQDFDKVVAQAYEGGAHGRTFPEMFHGLSHEAGKQIRDALRAIAPDTDWAYGSAVLGEKAVLPEAKKYALKLPRAYVTDAFGNSLSSRRIG